MLKIPSYRASLIIPANILPVTWPIVHFNQVSVTRYDNVRPLSRLLYLSTPQILLSILLIYLVKYSLNSTTTFSFSFSTLTLFFILFFSRINLSWICPLGVYCLTFGQVLFYISHSIPKNSWNIVYKFNVVLAIIFLQIFRKLRSIDIFEIFCNTFKDCRNRSRQFHHVLSYQLYDENW